MPKSQMSPPKCEGPICASVSQTKLFKVAFNEKNKGFLVQRGQSVPLQPLRPTSKDHARRSIPTQLQLLVFLTHGCLPPGLFLGRSQDSASRTTVSSKLVIFGDTQVHINR
ncbi:unnamed protein product [Coccothraustes coccothraustes]